MNNKLRLLLIALTIAILFACTFLFLSVPNVFFYDEAAVEELAHRIQVTPTFGHIARYAEASVRAGWSREEVESILQKIAPVEVAHRGELTNRGGLGMHVCDDLLLVIYPFHGKLSFSACYYGDGQSLFNFEYNES